MPAFRCVVSALLAVADLSATATTMPSVTKDCTTPVQAQSDDDVRRDHSLVIFVSATDGDDHWSGRSALPNHDRADGPLATLDHAREVVQSIDKSGAERVIVFFRGGTYYVPKTVTFREADSDTAQTEIVYANFPGESPVFIGGVRVQNWVNQGGNKWTTILPARTQYFENLFYNGCIGRSTRPAEG